jgi:hypothetical protein
MRVNEINHVHHNVQHKTVDIGDDCVVGHQFFGGMPIISQP